MSRCSHCLLDLSRYPVLEGGLCPNCGKPVVVQAEGQAGENGASGVAPVGPGAAAALLTRFALNLRDIIFRPASFFSVNAGRLVSEESLSSALAFAVIVQWLASFFNFLWRSTVGVMVQSRLDDFFRIAGDILQAGPGGSEALDGVRAHAVEFFFGAGAIILTPFTTIIKLALVAVLVHAAVRFFTKDSADRPHRYATTLKILAYASAPWILCVIPVFGVLLAYVLGFSAAVIGIREVYRTSTSRAVVAVAFPELLFMVFLFGMVVFLLFLAFNVLRLVF